MPTPRSRKNDPNQKAESGHPIPQLFQRWLRTALQDPPDNPRAGRGPSRMLPMPPQKVAAAYFHCLKLSLAEIARGASNIVRHMGPGSKGGSRPFKSVSSRMLGEWRSELEFNGLIERAKAEMIEALKGTYDSIEEAEEFGHFVNELMSYQLDIVFALVKYAEAVAESTGQKDKQLWADTLFLRWARACGGALGEQRRLRGRELFPFLELIKVAGMQFAKAEARRDWQLAREAFDSMEVLAKLHAAQRGDETHCGAGLKPPHHS